MRVSQGQPISAPIDVERYFITPQESGQLLVIDPFGLQQGDIFPKFKGDIIN